MKTSARNSLTGTITEVTPGAVNTEVLLKVSDTITLAAIVTNHSAETLGLAAGTKATALIKSSLPILMIDAGKTSARNQLAGKISKVELGAVNSEIQLDIGTPEPLTVIVTNESVKHLELADGKDCTALIKASQIILAVD